MAVCSFDTTIDHRDAEIDGILAALPTFYSLDLRGKGLSALDVAPLADAMEEHLSFLRLTSINVAENKIGDAGVERVASVVCRLIGVTFLDFSWNRLGMQGASALASSLPMPGCGISVLRLECNDLSDAGAGVIADVLPKCPSLRALDLAANRIGALGGISLAAGLARSNLERLELGRNFLGPRGVAPLVDALVAQANALCPPSRFLQSLGIAVNRIRDAGATALATALRSCQSRALNQHVIRPIALHALDLGGNQITDCGAKALATSLSWGEAPLRWLGLGRNKLSAIATSAFAEAMAVGRNSSLHTIVLVGNDDIGELASAEVTHALRKNSWSLALYDPLRTAVDACASGVYAIDLANVPVGPLGAGQLASALMGKRVRVCNLVLRNCMLQDSGASKLAAALAVRPPWLSYLDLSWNRLGQSSGLHFAKFLRSPGAGALELLDLECNDLACNGVDALVAAFTDDNCNCDARCARPQQTSCHSTSRYGCPSSVDGSTPHGASACSHGHEHESQCSQLRVLRLGGNRINGSGILGLASLLSSGLASLQEIDLGRNPLGRIGGSALGQGLASPCGALQKLGLAVTRLGDDGLCALSEGLRVRGQTGGRSVSLNLNGNRIGDQGISSFANAISEGAAVEAVSLEHNRITGDGIGQLSESLGCRLKSGQPFSKVTFTSFEGNPLTKDHQTLQKEVNLHSRNEDDGVRSAKRPRRLSDVS